MFSRCLTVLVLALPLVVTGCAGPDDQPVASVAGADLDGKEKGLTGDAARRALLEMDRSEVPPGVLVPPPKDEPVRVEGADEVSIGGYRCNLRERTFHASTAYPDAPRHRFNRIDGVFERDAKGNWVAKVTRSNSGD